MKNHEDNFDELHMENEDADLAGAYNSAIAVPDMWDRISAGFDAELENIKNEKLSQDNVKVNTDERQDQADITTAAAGDNKKHKKLLHYKSWIGLAAAVLLACIIAIPLIRSSIMRNRKTDIAEKISVDESCADSDDDMEESAAESYDAAESVAEPYGAETNKAAGAYDGDVYDSESENADSAASDVAAASEYTEITEDEAATDFEVEVSGSITRNGDEYILAVAEVLNTLNSDYTISENDRLELVGASTKLNLKDGETANYESIKLDNLTPLDEKDEAKAEYKAAYTAELVMLQ